MSIVPDVTGILLTTQLQFSKDLITRTAALVVPDPDMLDIRMNIVIHGNPGPKFLEGR